MKRKMIKKPKYIVNIFNKITNLYVNSIIFDDYNEAKATEELYNISTNLKAVMTTENN